MAAPRAGPVGKSDAEDESVGDATGVSGASVDSAVGVTGSGDGAGLVEAADDDAGADAANTTSSCIAPVGPAVVDEHPAIAAVTSTNPTVSSFIRVLIAYSDLSRWGCKSPSCLYDEP